VVPLFGFDEDEALPDFLVQRIVKHNITHSCVDRRTEIWLMNRGLSRTYSWRWRGPEFRGTLRAHRRCFVDLASNGLGGFSPNRDAWRGATLGLCRFSSHRQ
jgi:hypothetical protein